jgi:outer membrane putative beta-barrel porin/alpha-amylase
MRRCFAQKTQPSGKDAKAQTAAAFLKDFFAPSRRCGRRSPPQAHFLCKAIPRGKLRQACFAIAITLTSTAVYPQLPFTTDDADTTPKGKFHIEFSTEYDLLQRSAFPGRRQTTSLFSLNYGVTDRIEVGTTVPFIRIENDRTSNFGNPSGIGDTQFGVKIKLIEEHEKSRLPATSIVFHVSAPTGSARKQIGSGLTDYWLYGVLQKSFTKRTTGRVNGGILFAGNEAMGLVGVHTSRGPVFTANGSLVRDFTPRLRLGAELFGAVTNNFDLSRGQLVGQIGGGYLLNDRLELTFGVRAGRFTASPRFGAQVGIAYDFK